MNQEIHIIRHNGRIEMFGNGDKDTLQLAIGIFKRGEMVPMKEHATLTVNKGAVRKYIKLSNKSLDAAIYELRAEKAERKRIRAELKKLDRCEKRIAFLKAILNRYHAFVNSVEKKHVARIEDKCS